MVIRANQPNNAKARVHTARPLKAKSDFSSKVDIIIPFHGQYELCTRLVESILKLTRSNYYCLCLVDDASPNSSYIETVDANLNKRRSDVVETKCIRSDEQLGFAGAAKLGYDKTENPYCVFMHSDCEVTDLNWLRSLGESLLSMKSKKVRMISSKTNNPLNGSKKQLGTKGKGGPDLVLEDDEHLSMYCFMVHRELFYHTGGFLKPYPYGWYEDEEYAFRMKKHGFKQGVSGNSWVHHDGEKTMKSVMRESVEARAAIDENYDRCINDMKSFQNKLHSP